MSSRTLRRAMVLSAFVWICGAQELMADATAPPVSDALDSIGLLHFRAPANWRAVDQPAGAGGAKAARIYMSPDSTATEQAILILTMGDQKVDDFRAGFDAMVKQASANQKLSTAGDVEAGRNGQGYATLSQTVTSLGADGRMARGRFVAVNVDGRVALICYVGSLPDLYEKHRSVAEGVLASVSFAGSGPAPAAAAASAGTASADTADATKSAEEWARDAARRRKPHTVLGDITNSQGKPIKGLKGTVYVGGTTIRGDRSSFTLDVDDNGHFEMLVPDGVYRLTPTLTIQYDGQDMPVQLRPLDGKDPGASFGSADGIVRDYRWALTGVKAGLKPDHYVNFYGGHITLEDGSPGGWGHLLKDRTPPGTKFRLTLSPTGPLIDGSEGRPMQLEMDVAVLASGARDGIATVPIGVYKAAAELVAPGGGTQRLRLTPDPVNIRGSDSLEIHWKKEGYLDDVKTISMWLSDAP